MDKTTKTLLGDFVGICLLLCFVLLPVLNRQSNAANNLAGIHDYKTDHYDVAIQELTAYLKVHPLSSDHGIMPGTPQYAQHYLGLALMKQHRYEESVSVFRVYVQYASGNEKYYLLGLALMHNGEQTEARANFQKALDREMKEPMRGHDNTLIKMCDSQIAQIDQSR